jgi:lysozyme family protein
MGFDEAFEKLIGHEGGYVNHPNDPGGETKFGISKRAYPAEDIKALTVERAKHLYRRDYWDPIKGDLLPFWVAFPTFDAAVNHGVKPAVRMTQKSLGISADGLVGDDTIKAAHSVTALRFNALVCAERLHFYTGLANWPSFGKGWVIRAAKNLKDAIG